MVKMRTKNVLVFFLALVSVLFSLSVVSAAEIANINSVEVDGVYALSDGASVIAGESVTIRVYFNALEDASDVRIEAGIEGKKVDVALDPQREKEFCKNEELMLFLPINLSRGIICH